MSHEYTPALDEVKRIYVRAVRQAFIASSGEHEAEFDRFIAKHDAELLTAHGLVTDQYHNAIVKQSRETPLPETDEN